MTVTSKCMQDIEDEVDRVVDVENCSAEAEIALVGVSCGLHNDNYIEYDADNDYKLPAEYCQRIALCGKQYGYALRGAKLNLYRFNEYMNRGYVTEQVKYLGYVDKRKHFGHDVEYVFSLVKVDGNGVKVAKQKVRVDENAKPPLSSGFWVTLALELEEIEVKDFTYLTSELEDIREMSGVDDAN